jgi:hypothetical protein
MKVGSAMLELTRYSGSNDRTILINMSALGLAQTYSGLCFAHKRDEERSQIQGDHDRDNFPHWGIFLLFCSVCSGRRIFERLFDIFRG